MLNRFRTFSLVFGLENFGAKASKFDPRFQNVKNETTVGSKKLQYSLNELVFNRYYLPNKFKLVLLNHDALVVIAYIEGA